MRILGRECFFLCVCSCVLDYSHVVNNVWLCSKVKATFTQHFRISGGPNGRLIRGEEVVKVNVVECGGEKSTTAMDSTLSPRSRSAFGRKLWRHGVD